MKPILPRGLFLAMGAVVAIVLCSCGSRPAAVEEPGAQAGALEAKADSPAHADPRSAAAQAREAISTSQNFTPPQVTPPQWHDLLPLIEVKQDKLWGEWKIVDRELVGTPAPGSDFAPQYATLILPVASHGEYHLRLQLQLDATPPSATILLPVGSQQVAFSILVNVGGKLRS